MLWICKRDFHVKNSAAWLKAQFLCHGILWNRSTISFVISISSLFVFSGYEFTGMISMTAEKGRSLLKSIFCASPCKLAWPEGLSLQGLIEHGSQNYQVGRDWSGQWKQGKVMVSTKSPSGKLRWAQVRFVLSWNLLIRERRQFHPWAHNKMGQRKYCKKSPSLPQGTARKWA